jgi:RNA polymerase sigma factor (sigma-70 family)
MSGASGENTGAGRVGPLRLLTDERLARRAANGDRRAFEAIYARYHQDLYRFCLVMVSRPQDAQDALQNTMVKVLRALPGEKRVIQLKPWLYRIARNEAMEMLRRRRDGVELEEVEQPAPAAEVAQTAEARERLRRLMADLEQLPERQRAVLVMRELGDLGFEQIGKAFETSAAVARQTLYEARASLRQMEAGREMSCDQVQRELSDADGRVTRRREVRAHLRSCADCRAFRDAIKERRGELAAIAPLPLAASAGILHGVLGGGAAGGGAAAGGGVGGAIGAGAGKVAAASIVTKSVATVAVVAAVGVTAADRSGVIDVPIGGDGASPGATRPSAPAAHSLSKAGAKGSRRSPGSGQVADRHGARAGGGSKALDATDGQGSAAAKTGTGASDNGSRPSHTASNRRHGGGHSRSSGHGRRSGLPTASQHGQQTAGAHKSPNGNTAPGPGADHAAPSHDPPVHSAATPKQESSPTSPSEPATGESGTSRPNGVG